MKHREYKLTDEMLVELMEAHTRGVDFSAALKEVRIPELLVPEAQDYWKMFGGIQEQRSLIPRTNLFENIWAEVEVAHPAITSPAPSPISFIASPYMKQLFAVAGALGALVLVISSVQWNSVGGAPGPVGGSLNSSNASVIPGSSVSKVESKSLTLLNPAPAPKPLIQAVPAAAPVTVARTSRVMAKSATPEVTTMTLMAKSPPADTKDPKHLVAILSMTGTNEATADTYIDDNYDKQLAAYDAAMTADNDTSHGK